MMTQQKFLSLPFLRRTAEEESSGLETLMEEAERAARSVMSGEHRQRRAGAGEKFWQFREYVPGDMPRDIDWRQSARGDRVYVRQKEWQTGQTILLWRAGGPGMDYASAKDMPTKRFTASCLTLALAMIATRAGERAGMLDNSARPGRTDVAVGKIARALLGTDGLPLPETVPVPENSGLFLTGDFLDPDYRIETALAPFAERTQNAVLIQTLDPAEISLPFSGRVLFQESGGGERHHVMNVESVRTDYERRMRDHIDAIDAFCARFHWRHVLHVTGRPMRDTLLEATGVLTT